MFEDVGNPSAFERALRVVARWEGGWSNLATDPGGATNHGVSIRFAGSINLDIDGDGRTTEADIRALTPEYAAGIYRAHFWEKLRCGDMPYGLALAVFDGGVNQGAGVSARLLQRAAGVADDGIVGPVTLGAATKPGRRHDVLLDYMARRAKRYAETPTVEHNGRGWYRRLLDIHSIAQRALYP